MNGHDRDVLNDETAPLTADEFWRAAHEMAALRGRSPPLPLHADWLAALQTVREILIENEPNGFIARCVRHLMAG